MKQILLILIVVLFTSAKVIQQGEDVNAKIKVVYINNFTKYIEWPSDYKEGKFTITVFANSGANNVESELLKMAAVKKTATNQPFDIKSTGSINSISKSHIVYVTAENSSKLGDIINKVKGSSTLIITEKPGLAKQGSAINFVVKDNKPNIELNKKNANKFNLKISDNLASLAILVE